jgi:hypothetical protein
MQIDFKGLFGNEKAPGSLSATHHMALHLRLRLAADLQGPNCERVANWVAVASDRSPLGGRVAVPRDGSGLVRPGTGRGAGEQKTLFLLSKNGGREGPLWYAWIVPRDGGEFKCGIGQGREGALGWRGNRLRRVGPMWPRRLRRDSAHAAVGATEGGWPVAFGRGRRPYFGSPRTRADLRRAGGRPRHRGAVLWSKAAWVTACSRRAAAGCG